MEMKIFPNHVFWQSVIDGQLSRGKLRQLGPTNKIIDDSKSDDDFGFGSKDDVDETMFSIFV